MQKMERVAPKPSGIHHLELHVRSLEASTKFYGLILPALGFKKSLDQSDAVGYTNGDQSIFLAQADVRFLHHGFHRKRVGLNHIALRAGSRKEVDEFFHHILMKHKLPVLYGGPAEYQEYHPGYYAVYCEDPDRVKIEVVYTPR